MCRDPGLVHPLLGEIHKIVDERMWKGFDNNDLDFYVKVTYKGKVLGYFINSDLFRLPMTMSVSRFTSRKSCH